MSQHGDREQPSGRPAAGDAAVSPGPLHVRLRDIWEEVARGGGTLPGEPTLAAQLGVSRPAVREALVRLEAEGLIRRRHGADTVVNPAALDLVARFDLQVEYADLLAAAGFEASVDLLGWGWEEAGPDDAEALGVRPGHPLLRTTKRWRADGRPVMAAVDRMPVTGAEADRPAVDPAVSLFLLVRDLTGETVEWEMVHPSAQNLAAEPASWLEVPPGTAALTLDLLGVARSGRRAYRAKEYHLPGTVRYGFIRSVRP